MVGRKLLVGIHVHGRHVKAVGWERLVWGDPTNNKLGSMPKMVEVAIDLINQGLRPVIVFGTGASEKDGWEEWPVPFF